MTRVIGIDRFDSKVKPVGECFVWQAGRNHQGYGKFWWEGRTITAHRFAYTQVIGSVPDGMQLDHICHVRACVNPNHLRTVTPRENVANAVHHNGRRTHCPQGHEYSHRIGNGERRCRICNAEAQRRYRKRRREAQWFE